MSPPRVSRRESPGPSAVWCAVSASPQASPRRFTTPATVAPPRRVPPLQPAFVAVASASNCCLPITASLRHLHQLPQITTPLNSTHAVAPNRLGAILFGAAVVNPVCPAQTAGRFADRRPPGGSALTSAGLPKRVSSTRGFKSTMPPPASRPMFRIAPASSPTWPPAESHLHLPLARASSCLLAASAIYPATVLRRPPVSATGSSRAQTRLSVRLCPRRLVATRLAGSRAGLPVPALSRPGLVPLRSVPTPASPPRPALLATRAPAGSPRSGSARASSSAPRVAFASTTWPRPLPSLAQPRACSPIRIGRPALGRPRPHASARLAPTHFSAICSNPCSSDLILSHAELLKCLVFAPVLGYRRGPRFCP